MKSVAVVDEGVVRRKEYASQTKIIGLADYRTKVSSVDKVANEYDIMEAHIRDRGSVISLMS